MTQKFTIKPEHLKLLQEANVDWDDAEFGAPCIDPKRPYGNSDVYQDMIEILGVTEIGKENEMDKTAHIYQDGSHHYVLQLEDYEIGGTNKSTLTNYAKAKGYRPVVFHPGKPVLKAEGFVYGQ